MFAARAATDADVETILTMMAEFNAIEAIPFDRDAFRPRLATLLATPALGGVLVFTVDGAVAGYAVVTFGYDLEFGGRDAFLTEIFVVAGRRGRGVGTEGLAAAEAFAHERGAHALHLAVRPENAPARALYDKRGFVALPRILMSKRLG